MKGVRSDTLSLSVPHPVTANSLGLVHPTDRGFLHSHVMEVVCVVPGSMQLSPKLSV